MNEPVLVSVPYYGCPERVSAAVKSILAQDYPEVRVLVTNDGDSTSHEQLSDYIRDERLYVHDLPKNMGRYFVDAVVIRASRLRWFAVHDADDYCEPDWISSMVREQKSSGASAVFSGQRVHSLGGTTSDRMHDRINDDLTSQLKHYSDHIGLYERELLIRIGGYRPDFRVGYDSLVVSLIKMVGTVSAVDRPLYHQVKRSGSLTSDPKTGFGSVYRRAAAKKIIRLYQKCWESDRRPETVARIVMQDCPDELIREVESEASRLRSVLPW